MRKLRTPRAPLCRRLAEGPEAKRGLVLGTAGHIDHGKTRLVGALTGTDTDRLDEEVRRGISIELGFAELELPSGPSLSVVDVPGHERFVRTMVAGAGAIDLFLLVVAADDGVMPQTEEHLEALRALGVEAGVVALNKIDVADAETIAMAREEVRALLPDAPIVEVSAVTGAGLATLTGTLDEVSRRVEPRGAGGWPRASGVLHVDRSFTIAGAGTVVTGTVRGYGFTAGSVVRLQPGGDSARIRSIQVHGRDVDTVGPGHRAALNLTGIKPDAVPRGSAVATASSPSPSYRLDVVLLGQAAERSLPRRVQVHHGTRDVAARVVVLGDGFAQLRLEAPIIARARDRVVLRSISPAGTFGGAEVIDPDPRRHGPGADSRRLETLRSGTPSEIVALAVASGDELPADPAAWDADAPIAWALRRFPPETWQESVRALLGSGAIEESQGSLALRSEPAAPEPQPVRALDRTDLRLLTILTADGVEPRSPQTLADELGLTRSEVVGRLDGLTAQGRLVRVSAGIYYPPDRLAALERSAVGLAEDSGSISLTQLRDGLRTSRKYSQALLEHLDRTGTTVRRGDEHLLRSPGPSA